MEWVNPDNWWNENITLATPHVERIPCMHDTIQFIPDNSFSIIVPNVPIHIGSVQFGNQVSLSLVEYKYKYIKIHYLILILKLMRMC